MQDKQKLIDHKMALVGQYNALQEKIDSYGFDVLAHDCGTFRDLANKKKRIELDIQCINKQLEDIEKCTLSL